MLGEGGFRCRGERRNTGGEGRWPGHITEALPME